MVASNPLPASYSTDPDVKATAPNGAVGQSLQIVPAACGVSSQVPTTQMSPPSQKGSGGS